MKKTRKIIASVLITALLVVMSAMPAIAEDVYTPVSGDKCTFTKELVMDSDANVPSAVFRFTAAAGAAIPADAEKGTLAVIAGPVVKDDNGSVTAPKIADVVFTAGATEETDTAMTVTEGSPAASQKTVSKTAVIDFSGVTFSEPGVYRYIITEEALADPSISNDTEPVRTVDVYVEDNGSGLEVADYIMYSGAVSAAPKAEADAEGNTPGGTEPAGATKTDKYTGTYDSANLTFGKEVTGNQGSRDKYFKFTVVIEGAPSGAVYAVDLTNAEEGISADPNEATTCIPTDVTNPSVITVADDADSATATFYLRDGQYVTIRGLANGTSYSITEDAEDYTSTAGIDAAENKTVQNAAGVFIALNGAASGTIGSADVNTGYTNDRSGVIPTGLALPVVPVLIIGILVLGGIAALVVKAGKKEM